MVDLTFGLVLNYSSRFDSVVSHAHLNSIELWIFHAEVCIRDVGPSAGNVDRMARRGEQLNPPAAPRRELKAGSISRWQVRVGSKGTSREFNVRVDAHRMHACV